MVWKKLPEGEKRDWSVTIRFKPAAKELVQKKMAQLGITDMTPSEFMRLAVWEFCKDAQEEPN